MRTMVIVGSSTTRSFPRDDMRDWVYTPRWYAD
jgi:cobalt-precorrin 5A hydrolase/precorrin-3B C17-methyltransferase